LRLAIAGAGMAGAYLLNLLRARGFKDIDVYDVPKKTSCGEKSCAWGIAPSTEYLRLLSGIVEPDSYVVFRSDSMLIDGVKLGADMVTLDKPKLIKRLLGDTKVELGHLEVGDYDRVIDATGASRAFLGPLENDLVADCVQYRLRSEKDLGLWFRTTSLGYEWCFPLGGKEYHVGFGNLKLDVKEHDLLSSLEGDASGRKVRCKCYSKIRLASPYYSKPFTKDNIVGVGESIGTVGPLGGDGNLYSMQCAEMLVNNWDDLAEYGRSVLSRYDWMRKERNVLNKLVQGKMPSILDARGFVEHSKSVGVDLGLVDAITLFRRALKG